MIEYTIILAFAIIVLITGPGGDVLQEMMSVSRENHRGYSYAVSLSPLPDYASADEYQRELDARGYSADLIDRLAVDEADLYSDLETFNDRFDRINQINQAFDLVRNPPSLSDIRDEALNALKSSFF